MNWTERHLNWTLVLGVVGAGFVIFVLNLILALLLGDFGGVIGFIIGLVLVAYVAGWHVSKKGRNLWNALWIFAPFGIVLLLCLKNLTHKETKSKANVGTAKEAYYKAMEGDVKREVIEVGSSEPTHRSRWSWIFQATSAVLALAVIVAVIYGVVVTKERDALNTELKTVQSVLVSTQAQLSSTKQTLTSTQSELGSTKQTLTSTQTDLNSTKQTLTSTKQSLTSTQGELTSTNQRLSSAQNDLLATKTKMGAIDAKLKLYEDTMGIKIFSGVQPLARGARPIELVNNSAATNPSWQQLISFLLADSTDDRLWMEGIFVSGDFAEMLHNNAEAAGIRAALVGVFFEGETIGHGLNAFKTTDRGLVYVDSTGLTPSQILPTFSGFMQKIEVDKIAYVTKGKEYGLISLEQDTPTDYASYEKMKADLDSYAPKLEAYNQEVAEYNQVVAEYNQAVAEYERLLQEAGLSPPGSARREFYLRMAESNREFYLRTAALRERLFALKYGRPFEAEEKYLKEQREWLNSIRAQLDKAWEPLGITESIEIYW